MSKAMNKQQLAFIDHYVKCRNAAEAARLAGYSEKTARSQGQRLLTHADIRAQIEQKIGRLAKKNDVSIERVLRELAKGAFQELDVSEMKYSDKIKCLELLCKTLGMLDGNAAKGTNTESVQRRLLDALKGIGKGKAH